jgi:hypothetical protein
MPAGCSFAHRPRLARPERLRFSAGTGHFVRWGQIHLRFRVSGKFDHQQGAEAAGMVLFAQAVFRNFSNTKDQRGPARRRLSHVSERGRWHASGHGSGHSKANDCRTARAGSALSQNLSQRGGPGLPRTTSPHVGSGLALPQCRLAQPGGRRRNRWPTDVRCNLVFEHQQTNQLCRSGRGQFPIGIKTRIMNRNIVGMTFDANAGVALCEQQNDPAEGRLRTGFDIGCAALKKNRPRAN